MRTAALLFASLTILACSRERAQPPRDQATASAGRPPVRRVAAARRPVAPPRPPTTTAPAGHDFITEIRALRDVALCVSKAPWPRAAAAQTRHCQRLARLQQAYRDRWLTPAKAFLATVVPPGLPTTVVYPFAGGDLATALTVFPDAVEITTLSLEPAGDPRTLATLQGKGLVTALTVVADELDFLYRINFSNTMNMIGAMRGGQLPTQLVFSLSALELHGHEITAAYFFDVTPDGTLDYLDDADLASMPAIDRKGAAARNRRFGNVELHFRKAGETTTRVYRHINWNLDDAHLSKDARVIKHLAAKGPVAAMTKAASYLLHWGNFSIIRGYLLDHMAWMISDASGIPLKYAAPAGWTQEVWGTFVGAHMTAGRGSNRELLKLFKAAARRKMPVRFGYPDRTGKPHLIVTRKP